MPNMHNLRHGHNGSDGESARQFSVFGSQIFTHFKDKRALTSLRANRAAIQGTLSWGPAEAAMKSSGYDYEIRGVKILIDFFLKHKNLVTDAATTAQYAGYVGQFINDNKSVSPEDGILIGHLITIRSNSKSIKFARMIPFCG